MENALDAMKMAFGMLVLVIALSTAIYALNVTNSTVKTIVYMNDKTNFFDNLDINAKTKHYREIGKDTIVPTLYRYYKENFSVKLYNKDGKLVQIFDINTEGKVNKAVGVTSSRNETEAEENERVALLNKYNDRNNDGRNDENINESTTVDSTNPYLFEAPWIGNTNTDAKARVDLFIKGEIGYINNVKVDYSNNNLETFLSGVVEEYRLVESFVKYTYSGDTISVGKGDDIETITGSKQPEDKIEIIYSIKRIINDENNN